MAPTEQTESKHDKILEAAQRRFAQHGYAKVTMDEIAADLGISKAALYYYFKTKEDVFREVAVREQDEFSRIIQLVLKKQCSADHKLRDYVAQRMRFLNRLVNLRVLGSSDLTMLPPLMSEVFREFGKRELDLLTPIVRQGVHDGLFTGAPSKTAGLILHALQGMRILFVRQQQISSPSAMSVDDYERECTEITQVFLQGIIKR